MMRRLHAGDVKFRPENFFMVKRQERKQVFGNPVPSIICHIWKSLYVDLVHLLNSFVIKLFC
jgi:hypothetical protein